MQNCTFLVLLRPICAEKMKTAPPNEFGCQSCEEVGVNRPKKPFEFRISAEKSVSFSAKTFFFWRSPVFGLKKPVEFRILAKKSVSISERPCESDLRTMKIVVKVACSCLTLSKKPPPPPPPFFKSWLRACF